MAKKGKYDRPKLEQLAVKSGVTVEHLRSLGWTHGEGEIEKKDGTMFRVYGCRVPYYRRAKEGEGMELDGCPWPVVETMAKVRTGIGEGTVKYLQERRGPAHLLGEWLTDQYREAQKPAGIRGCWPWLLFVEGETDFAACRSQGLPVYGIPGANAAEAVLRAEHLEGFEKILIIREPGKGGTTFCKCISKTLRGLGWAGASRVVELPEKDPAALLRAKGEGFLDAFRQACAGSVSLSRIDLQDEAEGLVEWGTTIKPKPVRFLMDPYIPAGYLTLLVGTPGLGKSYAMMAISALISRGKVLANCRPETSELGGRRILVFSGEDRADETLMPRFLACGGDPAKLAVYRFEDRPLTLAHQELIQSVADAVRPSLIFFDPISRFLPEGVNLSKTEHVQPMLAPICGLGRRYRAGVVIVGWAPKGQRSTAMDKFFGSVAFQGSMRSGLIVQEAEDDKAGGMRRGVVSHAKGNLSPEGQSVGFQISPELAEVDSEIWQGLDDDGKEAIRRVGSFTWTGSVFQTADEIARRSGSSRAIEEAKRVIYTQLTGRGQMPIAELEKARKAASVDYNTWNAAVLDLISKEINPGNGEWLVGLKEEVGGGDDDLPF